MKKVFSIITLLKFPLWLVLAGLIAHGIATLEMEHYQPTDMPNERFNIAVIDNYPRNLQEFNRGHFRLQTIPDSNCIEDCLRTNQDGSLTYYNEGAMWNSQSTYRIENNQITPISYRFFSIGHVFYGMIGATLMIKLGNYVVRRFLYRHDKDGLKRYHQKIWHDIKLVSIVIGIALICYGGLVFL